MDIRVGIVLKKYFPTKNKIAVLDKELGKVEYVPMSHDICCGMLIQYYVQSTRGTRFMYGVENIGLPMHLVQHDLLFFHHLLELCYFYIPQGTNTTDIFYLLMHIYTVGNITFSSYFKKLFLIKFFMMMGMYPEDKKFQTIFFYRIAVTSIDILVKQDLDLGNECDLDEWLRGCVRAHPDIEKFKTVRFLDESRIA